MANPFYVQPAEGPGRALAGLGQMLSQVGQQRKAQARQAEMQSAMQEAVSSGDPNKMVQVSIKYPEARETMEQAFGFTNEQTKSAVQDTYRRVMSDPENAEEYLTQGINRVSEMGGRPDNMLADLGMFRRNPEGALQNVRMGYASIDPEGFKAIEKDQKRKTFKMGTGEMTGYVFDETTGEFSIDPDVKAFLAKDASEKATKEGMLDSKDIAGVNDKVTALTKDVRGIYNEAVSLDRLKEKGTAASKLAAVFKFMKALDPTSVVRETEQGQVYAAQGAASSLAGRINSLLGEGRLTESGFQDLVDTAKSLANSAVETSQREVSDYLGVLEGKMDQSDIERMKQRVPTKFEEDKPIPEGAVLVEDAQGNRAYRLPDGSYQEI